MYRVFYNFLIVLIKKHIIKSGKRVLINRSDTAKYNNNK